MAGPHSGNRNRPAYSGQPRFRFPPAVIKLFAPRPAAPFKPPPSRRRLRRMSGIAGYLDKFETPEERRERPKDKVTETPAQRRRRVKEERLTNLQLKVAEQRQKWSPYEKMDVDENGKSEGKDVQDRPDKNDESHVEAGEISGKGDGSKTVVAKTSDPFRTLFVANVPRTMLEASLQLHFEVFGPIDRVVMPTDRHGVPRGYAFLQFQREPDMKAAMRAGMRCGGNRLILDVERGRTVPNFFPNRLDGPFNSAARRKSQSLPQQKRQRYAR